MPDLKTIADADLAFIEAKAKLAVTSLLPRYALTWPYWASVVVLATIIGRVL
jgi:hypothetical protein